MQPVARIGLQTRAPRALPMRGPWGCAASEGMERFLLPRQSQDRVDMSNRLGDRASHDGSVGTLAEADLVDTKHGD